MSADLAERLRERALALGFDSVGITHPGPSEHADRFRTWLEDGLHGEMAYLARPDSIARRADLRATMDTVRSVVVVTHNYNQPDPEGVPDDPARGVVARYARGRDYHKVVKRRLQALHRWLEAETGSPVGGRAYVDTGPILERELGARAGLGWFGKNTMLIHPRRGSYFFLGVLLLDLDLPADLPFTGEHCGTCTRCLDACPTGALLGYDADGAPVMDARRCISYLTIEHRGPIPEELRPLMGNRVFGCDICQEVCPWNERFAKEAAEPGYAARAPGESPVGVQQIPSSGLPKEDVTAETRRGGWRGEVRSGDASSGLPRVQDRAAGGATPWHPGTDGSSLVELMGMTRDDWEMFSRGSAIRRAGYAGFRRNVAVALGNWLAEVEETPEEAVAALREALHDRDPLVREHAAWALAVARPRE